jgi:hypothetical protein
MESSSPISTANGRFVASAPAVFVAQVPTIARRSGLSSAKRPWRSRRFSCLKRSGDLRVFGAVPEVFFVAPASCRLLARLRSSSQLASVRPFAKRCHHEEIRPRVFMWAGVSARSHLRRERHGDQELRGGRKVIRSFRALTKFEGSAFVLHAGKNLEGISGFQNFRGQNPGRLAARRPRA